MFLLTDIQQLQANHDQQLSVCERFLPELKKESLLVDNLLRAMEPDELMFMVVCTLLQHHPEFHRYIID